MRLEEVKIKNFRCYSEEITIPFHDMTTVIGQNDAGKSTVLEALEIFFNNKTVKIDRDDLSNNSSDNDIEITCTFSDLPKELVIDSDYKTSLDKEYLLNNDDFLEIKKTYSGIAANPKESVSIVCNHPSKENFSDLLLLTQNQLRARATSLNLDKTTYNGSINADIRRAIWESASNLELENQEIPANKSENKKVYESIKKYLPMYSLFQSDRSSNDEDSEVTEPMKMAVESALLEVKDEIEEIKERVQQEAEETANRTLEKLREMDPELANELKTEFKSEPNFTNQFKLSILSDDGIPINKRGSGVRRLILMNFFRAEAEKRFNNSEQNSVIYAFEEPETSQHPDNQLMLVKSLIELSEADNTQVIITTHTPDIAKTVPLSGLRLIETMELKKQISFEDENVYDKISKTLGVYPTSAPNGAKAFLFVEGPGDVNFVNHTSEQLASANYISGSLKDHDIVPIPVGGCNGLGFWVESDFANRYDIPYFVLLDSDLGNSRQESKQKKTIEKLQAEGVTAKLTRKREPENYLHKDIVGIEVLKDEDAKVKIGTEKKINKGRVLDKYWSKMTAELIREVEQYEENSKIYYEFTDFFTDIIQKTNQKQIYN